MGYDVHISRAEDWTESEAAPISLEEWLAYVRTDTEMRLDGQASATTGGGNVITYTSDGLAVWTAYSRAGENGGQAWFDHRRGRIVVKNPDDEILQKMCRIARSLSARVQGDEGEFYAE